MCLEMKDSKDETESGNTETSPALIIGLGNIVFTLF